MVAASLLKRWCAELPAAATAGAWERVFAPGAHWRDFLAFTWNLRTACGEDVCRTAADTWHKVDPDGWALEGEPQVDRATGVETYAGWLRFNTKVGTARAHIRLDKEGRARTLMTALDELHDGQPSIGARRPRGTQHGAVKGRTYPSDLSDEEDLKPYVAIIGGGQAGMALGARLGLVGVPYVILESNPRAGDSWRKRYPSLRSHDPVWYNHMPFLPFPPSWPVFTPRDKMADWLEAYSKTMDLNFWSSTRVTRAVPAFGGGLEPDNRDHTGGGGGDGNSGNGYSGEGSVGDRGQTGWVIDIEREGRPLRLLATHLIFATGMSGFPRVPQLPGADKFEGVVMHSSQYSGGRPFRGKRAVVIGANTSAHDIAQDLWEQGAASVTMVQRSPTLVVSTDSVLQFGLGPLYSEGGIPHEFADYIATTLPYGVAERRWREMAAQMRENDADLHARLRKVGFQLDFGHDETGVFGKSAREGGGFYINVGASELLANGDIVIRSGSGVARVGANAVVLESGESLDADLLIYATGYGSMNKFVAELIGEETAGRVGRVWGYGAGTSKDPAPWEGELRNMWKPTAVRNLWFCGGNLAQSRHFSRFLALQMQARYMGLDTKVYGLQEVNHRG